MQSSLFARVHDPRGDRHYDAGPAAAVLDGAARRATLRPERPTVPAVTALALTGDERQALAGVAALLAGHLPAEALALLRGRAQRVGQAIAAVIEAGADHLVAHRMARELLTPRKDTAP
ncbi:hypothetical protein ACVFYP_22415 [Roseomonas sp. F4]